MLPGDLTYLARASFKNLLTDYLARVFCKILLKETSQQLLTRLSGKSILKDHLARASFKSMLKDYIARTFCKSMLQDTSQQPLAILSCKRILQNCVESW